jgi:hypothetical protein
MATASLINHFVTTTNLTATFTVEFSSFGLGNCNFVV